MALIAALLLLALDTYLRYLGNLSKCLPSSDIMLPMWFHAPEDDPQPYPPPERATTSRHDLCAFPSFSMNLEELIRRKSEYTFLLLKMR